MASTSRTELRSAIPPAQELTAVEHPCYVANASRGLRMLGGISSLSRVRRQRVDGGDEAVLSAEVVGTVSSSYRFEGLCDYQYVSEKAVVTALDATPRPASEKVPYRIENELQPLGPLAMQVPPSLFSMHDTPLEYASKKGKIATFEPPVRSKLTAADFMARVSSGSKRASVDPAPPPRRTRNRGGSIPMHFGQRVDMDAEAVPAAPPPKIAGTVNQADEVYLVMKAMFAQRPIWSRQALKASLPSDLYITGEMLRFRLPQLAYYFAQGPWRMCWISYGYDPRTSSDSRIYQVLDLRLPPGVEHLVPKKSEKRQLGAPARIPGRRMGDSQATKSGMTTSAGPASSLGTSDFGTERGIVPDDQTLPTQRHVYFQLCDFTGEALVALVHEEQGGVPPERCHKTFGWYSPETIDRLRQLLKEQMLLLADAACGSSTGEAPFGAPTASAAAEGAAVESIGNGAEGSLSSVRRETQTAAWSLEEQSQLRAAAEGAAEAFSLLDDVHDMQEETLLINEDGSDEDGVYEHGRDSRIGGEDEDQVRGVDEEDDDYEGEEDDEDGDDDESCLSAGATSTNEEADLIAAGVMTEDGEEGDEDEEEYEDAVRLFDGGRGRGERIARGEMYEDEDGGEEEEEYDDDEDSGNGDDSSDEEADDDETEEPQQDFDDDTGVLNFRVE